eukprot:1084678_1
MKRRSTATGFVSTFDKEEPPENSPPQNKSCWQSKVALCSSLFLVLIFVLVYGMNMKQSSQTQIFLVPHSYPLIPDNVINTNQDTIPLAPTIKPTDVPTKLVNSGIKPIDRPIKPTDVPTKLVNSGIKPIDRPIKPVTMKITKSDKTNIDQPVNIIHIPNTNNIYPRSSAAANITDFPPKLQSATYYSTGGKGKCNCPVPKQVPKYSAVQYHKHQLLKAFKPPLFNVSFMENNTVENVRGAWHVYQGRSSNMKACRSGFGMWAPWTKPGYHKCMAQNVGFAWKLKPGDIVLD